MDINNYLHYYFGQKFRCKTKNRTEWSAWMTWVYDAMCEFQRDMPDIQLRLRRIEDITEIEIFEMAAFGGLIGTPIRANVEGNFIQMEYVKDKEFHVEHWHPNELNPFHFHYLLSRGFDLFNLIDNGQAIDSQTLTQ